MSLKKTPLHPMHLKYKGRMIDFGGWELPVQYGDRGIIKEHHMVRENAGLFDVSHMGEILVYGEQASNFIQYMVCNDLSTMHDGQVLYTPMCYSDGGIVDDLLIYRFSPTEYLLVVNAANAEKDLAWLAKNLIPGVKVEDVSAKYAQLALQGPYAQEILQRLTQTPLDKIKFFQFDPNPVISGVKTVVSRTGYTGEDGFELYVNPDRASYLWDEILQAGGDAVSPIGLGARDSLRLEAKLPLYGQEIDRDISPLEAGLGFSVKLEKLNFIGQKALLEQKENGLKRKLVEFEMIDKGIPRTRYEVQKDGVPIGWVTSGLFSPTFRKSIGLALIAIEHSLPDTPIEIIIRGKPIQAVVRCDIFYQKKTKSK